jgi:hypothetical protein
MAENIPLCEGPGQEMGDSILSRIVSWLGIAGTIGGIANGIWQLVEIGSFGLAGLAGAALGLVIIGACVVGRLWPTKGLKGCYAGVVTSITPSFDDFFSNIAPYAAQHDRVDVVVKPTYWDIVE